MKTFKWTLMTDMESVSKKLQALPVDDPKARELALELEFYCKLVQRLGAVEKWANKVKRVDHHNKLWRRMNKAVFGGKLRSTNITFLHTLQYVLQDYIRNRVNKPAEGFLPEREEQYAS